MLNRAPCSQSYSAWRYNVFLQFLEDVRLSPAGRLPFLHPKTLHEHYSQPRSKRKYHTTPARCDQEARTVSSSSDQTKIRKNNVGGKEGARLQPRILRKVLLKAAVLSTLDKNSHECSHRVHNEATDEHPDRLWKPTSQEGQRDLGALVQSLKEMSARLKQPAQVNPNGQEDATQWQADDHSKLAISPLETHMQKKKWKPKRQPTIQEKEKLAGNPWAALLAGPIRLDAASKARFPHGLLMDVGHVENADDKAVYLLPDELADLEAFTRRLKSGHRRASGRRSGTNDTGEKLRILPYGLLVEALTDAFMLWDNTNKVGYTKEGAVAKRLYPGRWQQKAAKIAAYQNASKEYWALREKQDEIDNDWFKKPEKSFDSSRLQWRPDIVKRIPNIMRQRVLLALNHLAEGQNQPRDKMRKFFYSFAWPEEESLPASMFSKSVVTEYWNDMGDIESADAITGTGQRQGNKSDPRPPIAVQASEIRQEAEDVPSYESGIDGLATNKILSKPDKDDPRIWLPGSFVLHFGPPRRSLAALPYLDIESTSEYDNNDGTDPAFEHSKYIPPMIAVANTYRLPVFNIPAMLGRKFDPILARVLERHKRHIYSSEPFAEANQVIIVKSVAPGSHALAEELWQLWRYLGGRDCLWKAEARLDNSLRLAQSSTSSENDDTGDLTVPGTLSKVTERMRKSRSEYQGLSDKAWDHLHGLLGLKNEKKKQQQQDTISES